MPVATSNTEEHQHFDLKSAPPDGYVKLRRMTYGQTVQRRALVKMSVSAAKGRKDFQGEMAMANEEITRFEFSHCIVEHNLTKPDGTLLNLSSPVDFGSLDPRIGQEIEKRVGEMNNFEEEAEEGN